MCSTLWWRTRSRQALARRLHQPPALTRVAEPAGHRRVRAHVADHVPGGAPREANRCLGRSYRA
jgi:hypothetical protein